MNYVNPIYLFLYRCRIFTGYAALDKIDGNFKDLKKQKDVMSKQVKKEIGELLKELTAALPDMEIDKPLRQELLIKVSTACYGSCDFVEFKHGKFMV